MNSFREKIMRWLTVAVVLAVLIGGLLVVHTPYEQGKALRDQNAELDRQIAEKEREIAELKDNQRRFRSDADFVEQIARQNHRVYPGELVFIFDREERR